MSHRVHTIETAPEGARDELEKARDRYGFVPNLLGVMAEATALLRGYLGLMRQFEESSLTPTERQVVLLATSHENGCAYCVAAHSVIAEMRKVPADVISAIRDGVPIADPGLEALRCFTRAVVVGRGHPDAAALERFIAAGHDRAKVLEVVLGVGVKTLSNYTNHIAETPLDAAFAPAKWDKVA